MTASAKIIGAFDAKTRLPELLRAAQKGQRFTITHRGRPIAALGPVDSSEGVPRDKKGWPVGYFEKTFGSCPDLKRWPQGEFEVREPIK